MKKISKEEFIKKYPEAADALYKLYHLIGEEELQKKIKYKL